MSTQTENRLALQRQRAQIAKDRQRQRRTERDGKQVVVDDDDDDEPEMQVQDTTDYSDQIGPRRHRARGGRISPGRGESQRDVVGTRVEFCPRAW